MLKWSPRASSGFSYVTPGGANHVGPRLYKSRAAAMGRWPQVASGERLDMTHHDEQIAVPLKSTAPTRRGAGAHKRWRGAGA